MEYTFNINSSSSDEVYTVTFKFDKLTSINCSCLAGSVKMLCKHRLNLIEGDISALIDKTDSFLLAEVLERIDKEKLNCLFGEITKVEDEIKRLNSLKSKIKKETGLKISNGF